MSRLNVDPIDALAIGGLGVLAVGLTGQFTVFVALVVVGLVMIAYAVALAVRTVRDTE